MSRFDMSELEWQFIKCVLPNKSRGVKRVDDRRVINGIFMPFAQVAHGGICLNDTAPAPRFITASIAGRMPVSGTRSWMLWSTPTMEMWS